MAKNVCYRGCWQRMAVLVAAVIRLFRGQLRYDCFATFGSWRKHSVKSCQRIVLRRYQRTQSGEAFERRHDSTSRSMATRAQGQEQSTSRLRRFYTGAVRGMLAAAAREPNLDVVEEGRAALELFLRAICIDRFDSLCG